MNKIFYLIFLSLFSVVNSSAQDFPDQITTIYSDVFPCEITQVADYFILFKYERIKYKRKKTKYKTKRARIPIDDISEYVVDDQPKVLNKKSSVVSKNYFVHPLVSEIFEADKIPFSDTILTNEAETVLCEITHVSEHRIFYKYISKKNKIKRNAIPTEDVKQSTVEYFPKGMGRERIQFIEENGIIYSHKIHTPPLFPTGITGLNSYLINNVRVYPGDKQVFGNRRTAVLYSISIDENGKITDYSIQRSSSSFGFSHRCRALEKEIGSVIMSMTGWEPAVKDGENAAVQFYFPITFSLNGPRIFIYSSMNIFTIRGKSNKDVQFNNGIEGFN